MAQCLWFTCHGGSYCLGLGSSRRGGISADPARCLAGEELLSVLTPARPRNSSGNNIWLCCFSCWYKLAELTPSIKGRIHYAVNHPGCVVTGVWHSPLPLDVTNQSDDITWHYFSALYECFYCASATVESAFAPPLLLSFSLSYIFFFTLFLSFFFILMLPSLLTAFISGFSSFSNCPNHY